MTEKLEFVGDNACNSSFTCSWRTEQPVYLAIRQSYVLCLSVPENAIESSGATERQTAIR